MALIGALEKHLPVTVRELSCQSVNTDNSPFVHPDTDDVKVSVSVVGGDAEVVLPQPHQHLLRAEAVGEALVSLTYIMEREVSLVHLTGRVELDICGRYPLTIW